MDIVPFRVKIDSKCPKIAVMDNDSFASFKIRNILNYIVRCNAP